jgi:hypothetical protein
MIQPRRSFPAIALLAALAGCAQDGVSPLWQEALVAPAGAPTALVAPGQYLNIIEEYVDAAGNGVMVAEYPAGAYSLPNGDFGSVASVTIKTVSPTVPTGATSSPCITSTIQRIETIAGWTSSVKKPGGCDKEIIVALDNRATGQRVVPVPLRARQDAHRQRDRPLS